MISIVLPAYNAQKFLESTLKSIFKSTYYPFEVILIDNGSTDKKTIKFIDSLQVNPKHKGNIRIYRNKNNTWCNGAWNQGVMLAHGDYIAVLNADIILSENWDRALVRGLKKYTITCPYEHSRHHKKPYTLTPIFKQFVPDMMRGTCFMFKMEDRNKLFPIPGNLLHWCGDNYLSDVANQLNGISFRKSSSVYHYVSQSSATIKKSVYIKRIKQDVDAYEKMSGRDMTWLKTKVF